MTAGDGAAVDLTWYHPSGETGRAAPRSTCMAAA